MKNQMDEYYKLERYAPPEIIKFLKDIFLIYQIRGRVGGYNGIKFVVHTMEKNHVIPHIHAEYGKYNISIEIDSQRILAGNLPAKQQKFAQQWVKEHRGELLSKWSDIALSAVSQMTRSGLDFSDDTFSKDVFK